MLCLMTPETKVRGARREAEQGDNFYVIESGIFAACIKEKRVFVYEGKGAFGELALMYNCPRAATVQACAACLPMLHTRAEARLLNPTKT